MKVLKFGGTSVGTAESIENVGRIIHLVEGPKILVLSAMSGVTNILVSTSERKSKNEILELIERIRDKHVVAISQLISQETAREKLQNEIDELIEVVREKAFAEPTSTSAAEIVTIGETMLTQIFSAFLKDQGISNVLLDAKKFMHVQNLENPNTALVGDLLHNEIEGEEPVEIYITQGFVRIDEDGDTSTLKRGGSDYTATIIGAAIQATEVQIWTDIDGFHNNDPRYVEGTHPLAELSYDEAAELAYFGAKILHPQTVAPVTKWNIPIYLKNTFKPEASGTKISSDINSKGLKAISAKDGITAIKIKSNRMLMAHGFLRKIFEVFDRYETAIDMITTSEIAISLTIDDTTNLDKILLDLEGYGEISVEMEHSIICIVGEEVIKDVTSHRIFEILKDIPVRMISYGGSDNNISLLVATDRKIEALQKLNYKLFEETAVNFKN